MPRYVRGLDSHTSVLLVPAGPASTSFLWGMWRTLGQKHPGFSLEIVNTAGTLHAKVKPPGPLSYGFGSMGDYNLLSRHGDPSQLSPDGSIKHPDIQN